MKPILFNTEMVKAILEGRKTVTRRVIKGQDKNTMYAGRCALGVGLFDNNTSERVIEPPYRVGDILYVRETWHKYIKRVGEGRSCRLQEFYGYKASIANSEDAHEPWKPSIHMPKEAARIFLRVTSVRVERLQDITEVQATKEGCKAGSFEYKGAVWGQEDTEEWTAVEDFANVWQSTIKKDQLQYGWCANPYVWVIEFEDISEDIKNGRV